MVLEQYLVSTDDGWIFRKAQYYRGALQPEDENKGGRDLLRAMAVEPDWQTTRFTLLREAVRFFPHGLRITPISEMRQLSRTLTEADPAFEPLRTKIHVRPDAGDAERVRQYAEQKGKKELSADYEKLAAFIKRGLSSPQHPHGASGAGYQGHVPGAVPADPRGGRPAGRRAGPGRTLPGRQPGARRSLLADANRHVGITHRLIESSVDSGLTGLNPGIARGVLRVTRPGDDPSRFSRNGIYVLPATLEDLPPVAEIITADKGNMLSHVQLLARNLGIPNVAVDRELLPRISALEGRRVVLAVSPGGIVRIAADGTDWDEVFARESKETGLLIRPDLEKLDLSNRRLVPLTEVRAADSDRICGPKAANLGELKHHFPEAVTEGVVIPFASFKSVLDQLLEPGGPTIFQWMQDQYVLIREPRRGPGPSAPGLRAVSRAHAQPHGAGRTGRGFHPDPAGRHG